MKGEITSELHEALKYNLSFAGCGFLGIYHVGVAVAFKKYAPQLLLQKISGASAGALAATCLLTGMPLGEMTSDFFRIVNEARSHTFGPFSPSFNIQNCLLEGMSRHLPEDAHLRVNGKLHISLTRVYDGKSVIVSQFNSRDDLLDALMCACFIPGFSGIFPPKFHGVRYMDGAFSDNLPMLDENTVTVSPFCGESDICPRDGTAQLFHVNLANTSIEVSKNNIQRFARILFPPPPEILSNMCQQGFDDALHFLHRNNLISCTRCLAIQSTFILSKQTPEHYDPECSTCSSHRDESLINKTLPETVLSAMEKYIRQKSNSGFFRLLQQPALFIFRTLSIPATIATMPMVFVYATLSKILESASSTQFKNSMSDLTTFLMDNLHQLLIPRQDSFHDMNNYAERIRVMYDEDPVLKQFERINRRRSIVDLNPSEIGEPDFEVRGNILSRRNSALPLPSIGSHHNMMSSSVHSLVSDVEMLDQVASVASHHDTLYSYHYMDETDNTMKFTKIFDFTDSDSQVPERDHNQNLQSEDSDAPLNDDDEQSIVQHDLDVILPESKEIMGEYWTCAEIKVDEINSDALDNETKRPDLSPTGSSSSIESMDSFYKPEADQSEHEQNLLEHVTNALRREARDFA